MTTTLAGVLTDVGAQLIEEAYQAGQAVVITQMALGDGGGNPVDVNPSVTNLVREFHRQLLDNGVAEDAILGGSINYIPEADHRGKWLREFGLLDASGNLIVYAAYSPSQIPENPNMAAQFIISLMVPVMNIEAIEVQVNPEGTVTQEEFHNHTHNLTLSGDVEGSATLGASGVELEVEVKDNSHSHTIENVNGLNEALREKLDQDSYQPRTDSLNSQQGEVAIISNKDMNTCVAGEFGLYEKATCANSPVSAGNHFYCETKSIYLSDVLIQIAWTYDGTGVLAWRNYSKNTQTWDAQWREAYDTGHKPTPADIGAAAQVHTHPGSLLNPITLAQEDLDTLQTPGHYAQHANANTSAAQHYPENNAGSLIITSGAGVQQCYHVYNSSHIWTRAKYGDTPWTPWARDYNTQNKPTPADIGAAAASHTHPWSQVTEAPATATRWPDWGEVTDKPETMPPSAHTHTADQGNADIVAGNYGQVGTYVLASNVSGATKGIGDTVPGSSLVPASAGERHQDGVSLPGTWKSLGYSVGSGGPFDTRITLWIRIA